MLIEWLAILGAIVEMLGEGATLEVPTVPDGIGGVLSYGALVPAMIWAYRTISRAAIESRAEAWQIVDRLREENERLESIVSHMSQALACGDGRPSDNEGHTT